LGGEAYFALPLFGFSVFILVLIFIIVIPLPRLERLRGLR
jgi:hypothetical protein